MASYATQSVTYGRAFIASVLAALKTDPGAALVVAGKLRLSKDPGFLPTKDSTIAALAAQEAAFSGYTAGGYAVVLSAPVNLTSDIPGDVVNVIPTATVVDPFVANTVYGWWIDDGVNVVCGERFAGGQTFGFSRAGDFLDLLAALPFGYNQPAV